MNKFDCPIHLSNSSLDSCMFGMKVGTPKFTFFSMLLIIAVISAVFLYYSCKNAGEKDGEER